MPWPRQRGLMRPPDAAACCSPKMCSAFSMRWASSLPLAPRPASAISKTWSELLIEKRSASGMRQSSLPLADHLDERRIGLPLQRKMEETDSFLSVKRSPLPMLVPKT